MVLLLTGQLTARGIDGHMLGAKVLWHDPSTMCVEQGVFHDILRSLSRSATSRGTGPNEGAATERDANAGTRSTKSWHEHKFCCGCCEHVITSGELSERE